MKCIAIQKENMPILIQVLPEGCFREHEKELLDRCRKYIAEADYEIVTSKIGEEPVLSEGIAYYEKQGYEMERYVEMDMPLAEYQLPTMEIPDGLIFGYYKGDLDTLHEAVAQVEEDWVQYFDENGKYFCSFFEGKIASFCIVGFDEDCVLSEAGIKIGSVGCVGTVPGYRKKGIGFYMVALATQLLKEAGCDKSFIHYTALEHWYSRLGYKSFMSFYLGRKRN